MKKNCGIQLKLFFFLSVFIILFSFSICMASTVVKEREAHFEFILPDNILPMNKEMINEAVKSMEDKKEIFLPLFVKRLKRSKYIFQVKGSDMFLSITTVNYAKKKGLACSRAPKKITLETLTSKKNIDQFLSKVKKTFKKYKIKDIEIKNLSIDNKRSMLSFYILFNTPEGKYGKEFYATYLTPTHIIYFMLFGSPSYKTERYYPLFQSLVESVKFKKTEQVAETTHKSWIDNIKDNLKSNQNSLVVTLLLTFIYYYLLGRLVKRLNIKVFKSYYLIIIIALFLGIMTLYLAGWSK